MLWCGPRMWSRSASWQPCAIAMVCPSSPLAQAPAWRVVSVLCRYGGPSQARLWSYHTCHICGAPSTIHSLIAQVQTSLPAILSLWFGCWEVSFKMGSWVLRPGRRLDQLAPWHPLLPGRCLHQSDTHGPNPGAESRRLFCGGGARCHPQSAQHPHAGQWPLVSCR